MSTPVTAWELRAYRSLRCRYLIYGRGALSKEQWSLYRDLDARVRRAIADLDDPHRRIAEMYYVRCMTQIAIGIREYYCERHVRRLCRAAQRDITSGCRCDASGAS